MVRGVEVCLEAGQMVWIGGPSGTGKTTLLLALARLLPLDDGELSLDGVPARQVPAPEWRSQVLLAPHPALALGETVREDLLSPYRLRQRRHSPSPGQEILRRELASVGLGEVDLAQPARHLSQGQLGRLALVRALLARPAVLLLDEPTANLDADAGTLVQERVAAYCAEGGAVVVAAHGTPWQIPEGSVSLPSWPEPGGAR